MNERYEREETVFEAAVQLPPEQRAEYLDETCADDLELRQRVESLLGALERATGLLKEAVVSARPPVSWLSATEREGDTIGRYKLLKRLGEGGCGVVYMAEQEEPVRRRVALKIIKPGMDSKTVIARFEAERQAMAMMDHPNIAKFFDAGVTETGRPYFVMELVRGRKITDYCDQNELDTTARLDLFIQVCHAVQHAHQKGIIHRDLKPSNILITSHDGVPVPKVIDFGIAKAMQGRLTEQTVFTAFEQFIGTPAYMSPEQAELSGLDIDTRSDIYSLGVLLYELLTGKTPFDAKELVAAGLDEMRQTIREREPLRPSTCLSTMAAENLATTAKHRHIEAPKLVNLVSGDLDWIVMKCLEKDRTRRYETANGLAMDVRRHSNNEPVAARPPSKLYEFQKTFRRHRFGFTATAAIIIVLMVGIAATTWQAARAIRARKESQAKAAELLEQNYVSDMRIAYQAIKEGNLGEARTRLAKYEARPGQKDLRGFEWRFLAAQTKAGYVRDLGPYVGFLSGIALSPDGQFVALSRDDPSRLEVLRFGTGKKEKAITTPHAVCPLTYSSSGRWLVGFSGDQLVCWDTRTWEARKPVPLGIPLAFGHHTNEDIFVARASDHLELWSATYWRKIGDLANSPSENRLLDPSFASEKFMANAMAVAGDDSVVYLAEATEIRRWDLRQRTELPPFPIAGTTCLATSGTGQLAAADRGGRVFFIDPQTGQSLRTYRPHLGWITGMKFARDGTRLVSAGVDRRITVYDPLMQSVVKQLLGHKMEVWGLDISADAERVVSGGGYRGKVLTWSLRESASAEVDLSTVKRCAILADGRILIQQNAARRLEYYDPVSRGVEPVRSERLVQALAEGEAEPFVVSPDGRWVLFRDRDAMMVWNLPRDRLERTLPSRHGTFNAAVFSPNSNLLLTTGANAGACLWRTGDWKSKVLWRKGVLGVGFSGDSKRAAIAAEHDVVHVFELSPEPREIAEKGESEAIFSVALSHDGRWLAAGRRDDVIRIWDLATGRQSSLHGHTQGVMSLSFSPDDRTLASSAFSRLILWHTRTWQKLLSIDEELSNLQFSPDGQYLAALQRPIRKPKNSFIWSGQGGLHLWGAPASAEVETSPVEQAQQKPAP